MAKERISKLEDMSVQTTQTKMQRKKDLKNGTNVQELWDNFKRCNMHIIGIPEG